MRCRDFVRVLMSCVLVAAWAALAAAAVKLPAVISDNMVLQRDQPVPIWGWADKGETVTVSILGQTKSAEPDATGKWMLRLDPVAVGGPCTMTVAGKNSITLKNVLVGEVWVCSGQSNMVMKVKASKDAEQEIAAANYPQIRLFAADEHKASEPQADCVGRDQVRHWTECGPAAATNFSAAAYFFGRQLHKKLNVPVGLISTAWGGTGIECWMSRKTLASPTLVKTPAKDRDPSSSLMYNGMIAPLMPYAIRGVIWYQGEANVWKAHQYRTQFPAMIASWRAAWGQGDFPFGFVQISPYGYSEAWPSIHPVACAELWEAQAMTLKSAPNTGMAVTVDITDSVEKLHPKNEDYSGHHPTNKQEVGRRLALWALAKVYSQDLVYSGPIYKSMTIEGNKIRLQFDHVGGGLIASGDKPLTHFTIAGTDQKFVPAVATIDGNSLVVGSDQIARPVAVRFAWREDATPNFANKEGLPASPFRTDRWKGVTKGK